MSKERANHVILLGNRQTIRFLREREMDIDAIVHDIYDISGNPPPSHIKPRGTIYDFEVLKETSEGMEVRYTTWKGIGYGIRFLEYLAYVFPDLYIRAEYNYHNSDGCVEGYWIAETVDRQVKITEVDIAHKNADGGCPFYEPLWMLHTGTLYICGCKGIELGSEVAIKTLEEVRQARKERGCSHEGLLEEFYLVLGEKIILEQIKEYQEKKWGTEYLEPTLNKIRDEKASLLNHKPYVRRPPSPPQIPNSRGTQTPIQSKIVYRNKKTGEITYPKLNTIKIVDDDDNTVEEVEHEPVEKPVVKKKVVVVKKNVNK